MDHIDLPLDALVERLDQGAEATAGEDLEDVQLGIGGEAPHSRRARTTASGDDAGAMGPVPEGVTRPGVGLAGLDDIDSLGHMAKKRVGVVASGVDQTDLDTSAVETVGQMIELHHPLTPADQSLARKVWKALLQGTKPD